MKNEAFDKFFEEIGKYPSMWDSLELKAVGGVKGESLCLLAFSCTLSEGLRPSQEILFESPDLIIAKEIRPLTELHAIVGGLRNGSVAIGGRALVADGFTRFECRTWGGGQGWVDTKYPYILLHSGGKSVSELVDEAAIERKLEQWGYRCLWDLSQEKVGFPVGGAYLSQIRFIAPIYLEADAKFTNDHLRLILRCWPSLNVEDLSAGYEVTLNYSGIRKVERGKLNFVDASRINDIVGFTLVKELDLLPQAESAIIWFFHTSRSEPLYTLRVLKPATVKTNPVWGAMKLILSRHATRQILYAEEIHRESLGLTGETKQAGRFEAAVHNLMACLGYNCIFTGRELGTQGIDTLAFYPSLDKVLAISVTTTNDIREKIRTMLPMLEKLRSELENLTIVPLICASISPNVVLQSDRENAKAHKVSLVLLPQLEQLINAVRDLPMSEAREQWESILEGE